MEVGNKNMMDADRRKMTETGLVNRGNWGRIERCMERAKAGERLVIGFIGGSITQGAVASTEETCYAYRVYKWWCERFPEAECTYLNTGIGATTSHFAVARVEADLLSMKPDFVVVEFSVNDNDESGIDRTAFFEETYEGLLRRIYGSECEPAVVLLHNVRYNDGSTMEETHSAIGKAYDLPCISIKKSIYPYVADGTIPNRDITPDDLHPNDIGHGLVAEVVTCFLQQVYEAYKAGDKEQPVELLERPLTANTYEDAVRLQNYNSHPICKGFAADQREQKDIRNIFARGFMATQVGDSIIYEVTGSNIAVQYRKSIQKPTPIAIAIVDGDEEHAVVLDGNFKETWGDKLYLETLLHHGKSGTHKLEVRIVAATGQDKVPFYLTSVIVAGTGASKAKND